MWIIERYGDRLKMTTTELSDMVTAVISAAPDYEVAHSMEDELMKKWIREHASFDELGEFIRMWEADFPRYCA